MRAMASQITNLTIVYSTFYSGAAQRKLQGPESWAFVREVHQWPVNSRHKGPVTQKHFHLTTSSCCITHWGQVTYIWVSKLTIIGSDNGLSPGWRNAIIWTNAGILLIRTLGTNFSEILSGIHAFWFEKMHLKMSSAKWRPFCLGLNVLTGPVCGYVKTHTQPHRVL